MDARAPHDGPEVRLERMLPHEVRAAMEAAPVAWVPWGALEYHADHLPFGTDGFAAQAVVERAARRVGGVVLPWTALTIGTLHLDWTFRFDADLVAGALRQTLRQLSEHGARVAVVHTGHGPLDLAHLIKRVCAEVETEIGDPSVFRAYGLCYLELNAALGAGLGSDWPVAIDHGSVVETSWVMAMEPDLVRLEHLPSDEASQPILGIYGPDPRGRASAALGGAQLQACAELLADRVSALLDGAELDTMADLRAFVERYWPEPLRLAALAGAAGEASLSLTNPAPVSRYLTGLRASIDGAAIAPDRLRLVNRTAGESGAAVDAASLDAEHGFYVRRDQSATVELPDQLAPGRHEVLLELGLAGVTSTRIEDVVDAR